jgi:predicted ArsR family transcriptional regulator
VDRSAIAAVATLNDPTRAAVFECAQGAEHPVTREDVAQAVGISRKLAAFHLDRLVAAGLLRADTAATPRRVGRAPKGYVPSRQEIQVSLPPRDYESLAEILLSALTEVAGPDDTGSSALITAAADRGRVCGAELSASRRLGRLGPERALSVLTELLNERGYLPVADRQTVRLRNCPFQPLAAQHPELVCAMNHAFLAAVLDGLSARGVSADLVPDPAGCCVQVHSASAAATREAAAG